MDAIWRRITLGASKKIEKDYLMHMADFLPFVSLGSIENYLLINTEINHTHIT